MNKKFDKKRVIKIAENCYKEKPTIQQYPSENNFVFLLKFKNFEKVIKIAGRLEDWMIDKEIYLLKLVKKHKIPVPKVEFSDIKGKIIPNHWYIMEKLGEKDLNQIFWAKEKNVDKLFIEAGKILAKIHNIKFDEQGFILANKIKKESFYGFTKNSFDRNIKELTEADKISKLEIEKSKKLLSRFRDSDEKSLCHHDYGPWQVIVKDSKISGIIDWEFARSSNPVSDFAKSEFMINTWSGNFDLFRKGYEEIKKLPADYDVIKKPYQLVAILDLMNFFKNRKEKFNKCKEKFLELIA